MVKENLQKRGASYGGSLPARKYPAADAGAYDIYCLLICFYPSSLKYTMQNIFPSLQFRTFIKPVLAKHMELQQELVKKANNKEAYDEIADQIFALREKRQQASMDTVQRDEQLQRITELQDFIKDQPSDLTVFDEALVKRWLKQITIWPTHCTVELKSGLKVDVER